MLGDEYSIRLGKIIPSTDDFNDTGIRSFCCCFHRNSLEVATGRHSAASTGLQEYTYACRTPPPPGLSAAAVAAASRQQRHYYRQQQQQQQQRQGQFIDTELHLQQTTVVDDQLTLQTAATTTTADSDLWSGGESTCMACETLSRLAKIQAARRAAAASVSADNREIYAEQKLAASAAVDGLYRHQGVGENPCKHQHQHPQQQELCVQALDDPSQMTDDPSSTSKIHQQLVQMTSQQGDRLDAYKIHDYQDSENRTIDNSASCTSNYNND